eukprot:11387431-Prorocentrum_lima.AAC.1
MCIRDRSETGEGRCRGASIFRSCLRPEIGRRDTTPIGLPPGRRMTAPRRRQRGVVAPRKRGARKLRDVWRCAARLVKVRARILFKAIGY